MESHIATPILFFAGGSMVYYFIAPVAWKFFLSYQNLNSSGIPIRLEAKMGEYLSLMMRFIFAFGLAFQLPVVITLLAKANLVTYKTLKKFRKYAIVSAFLAAAFFPGDSGVQLQLNRNGCHAPAETNVGAAEENQVNSPVILHSLNPVFAAH